MENKRQYINVCRNSSSYLIRELVNGHEVFRKESIQPILFTVTSNKTKYRDFYNKTYLEEHVLNSVGEMKELIEQNKDFENEIWGSNDLVSQYLYYANYNEKDQNAIKISFLDIEVCTREKIGDEWIDGGFPLAENAKFPINAICDYRSDTKKYHVFTTAPGWEREKSQLKYADEVEYHYCKTEADLLKKWYLFYKTNLPHVITGWNVKTFDIPYIINRIKNLYGEEKSNKLSPWNKVIPRTEKTAFGSIDFYQIYGISILDYLDLYKKYRYVPREKYTLDYISRCENPDDVKLRFEGTHGSLYYDDPVFFVDYNIQDVRCVVCFERDLKFISLVCYLSYFSGINFEDNYSPVKVWETLIYRYAMDNYKVIPFKTRDREIKKESYEGAYVHPPVPGLKHCISSFDFTSLYPSIMRLWYTGDDVHQKGEDRNKLYDGLISVMKEDPNSRDMLKEILQTGIFNEYYINNDIPEKVTEYLKENGVSLTTNCEFFDVTRKSVMIELISNLFKERKADKKTSFNYKHKTQDILEELEKRGIKV